MPKDLTGIIVNFDEEENAINAIWSDDGDESIIDYEDAELVRSSEWDDTEN